VEVTFVRMATLCLYYKTKLCESQIGSERREV